MQDVGRERGQKMGVVFKDLNVYGSGSELQFQSTVSSMFTAPLRIGEAFRKAPSKRILKNFNGRIADDVSEALRSLSPKPLYDLLHSASSHIWVVEA